MSDGNFWFQGAFILGVTGLVQRCIGRSEVAPVWRVHLVMAAVWTVAGAAYALWRVLP